MNQRGFTHGDVHRFAFPISHRCPYTYLIGALRPFEAPIFNCSR
jgi:hypothetical protein